MFTYFTEILSWDVVDRHGRWLGHPYDFTVQNGEAFPRATALIVRCGTLFPSYLVVPWKDLHAVKSGFQLKVPREQVRKVKSYRGEFATLRSHVLDQQVVDTFNRKVVRVNDVHFLRVDDDLRLAHVDIGMRGLVRRLGFERGIDSMVRLVHRHASYLTDEGLISWKYVQPLSIEKGTGKLQLTVEMEQLRQIPPSDISSMLMELDAYQRAALVKTLDVQSQVDIITELEIKWQRDLIEELDTQTAVALFEKMPADEATDILAELTPRDRERILGMISPKKTREIKALLEHEADSAGGLMTTEFIALRESMTVEEAIDYIRRVEIKKVETIYIAFVVDEDGVLEGAVTFRRLLLEPNEARIGEVMQRKPPAAHVADSVKDVAYMMDKYNLYVIATVNDDGHLVGIITMDDVLHVAVQEAWGKRTGL